MHALRSTLSSALAPGMASQVHHVSAHAASASQRVKSEESSVVDTLRGDTKSLLLVLKTTQEQMAALDARCALALQPGTPDCRGSKEGASARTLRHNAMPSLVSPPRPGWSHIGLSDSQDRAYAVCLQVHSLPAARAGPHTLANLQPRAVPRIQCMECMGEAAGLQ